MATNTRIGKPGTGTMLAAFFQVLLLGGWLGSMLFFSFAVAQSAFSALPSRQLAGLVVASTLSKLEWVGIAAGLILIAILLANWSGERVLGKSRLLLVFIMTLCAVLSRFVISSALISLRTSMGTDIDSLSQFDPLRVRFNSLHAWSVALMMTAMTAGVAALFLTVRSLLKRST